MPKDNDDWFIIVIEEKKQLIMNPFSPIPEPLHKCQSLKPSRGNNLFPLNKMDLGKLMRIDVMLVIITIEGLWWQNMFKHAKSRLVS